MITFLLVFLSIATFSIGVYFELPEISLFALQLFSVFVLCCFIDAVFGLLSLRRAATRRGARGSIRHPLTWVGRQFSTYQEAISYRINSLSDQVESNSERSEVQTPEPTVGDQNIFFDQLLTELEVSFKPASCAVVLREQGDRELQVLLKGIRGRRIHDQLKAIFSDWFAGGNSSWLGLQDTLHHDFPNDELSGFGLRYLVSACFTGNDKKGILVLGFGPEKEPSALIVNRLDDYTKRLERELATFASFQQLKSRADQAEKTSDARAEFLTHISHDIKSPLNNVKAIITLLREDVSASLDGPQLIETALRNCDSVSELVDSLIDFAKHRSGKLVANKSDFDLSSLVDEVVQNFEVGARSRGLNMNFISPLCKVICSADKTQIRRILTNIIGNSVKYTQAGRITIGINAQDEHSWSVRITDTGPGFSDQQLKELFTPFTRFDTEGIEGVGLGLTVSKVLSELNGGNLQVRSVQGAGSEFTVSVPSSAAVIPKGSADDKIIDFSTVTQHLKQQERIAQLQDLRLLVVDDDPDATQGLSRILAKEGADVAQANTVPDAVSILNFDKPDVLITDANMPDGGGKRLIKFVRLNSPDTAVLVVTGDVSKADELIALGAACVMDKPVHISELIDYLEDILESNSKQRAVGA